MDLDTVQKAVLGINSRKIIFSKVEKWKLQMI